MQRKIFVEMWTRLETWQHSVLSLAEGACNLFLPICGCTVEFDIQFIIIRFTIKSEKNQNFISDLTASVKKKKKKKKKIRRTCKSEIGKKKEKKKEKKHQIQVLSASLLPSSFLIFPPSPSLSSAGARIVMS